MNRFGTFSIIALAASAFGVAACDSEDGGNTPADQQVVCDGSVCTITAPMSNPITEDLTLTADKQWLLKGGVFIGNDKDETVLTIDPGTTIYGETASKAFLTITRGSKIKAIGTKDAPIVFTSSKEAGTRKRGDWGGLVINGRAPINGCDAQPCSATGEGGTGEYGGDDPTDDSGTLKYVRVEFAGFPITPDNELNGIGFQGVGSGTTLEYIQVHMADDDGMEFFGGTAQWKYVLTTGIADDNLDWTDGWQGKGQFFIAQQYPDKGDNGIEADNNGEANDAEPRSYPILSNLTLIGVPTSETSDTGMLLREGTAANIYNAVVLGWNGECVDVDHAATFAVAKDETGTPTGDLVIENSVFSCATVFKMDDEEDADGNKLTDPWSLEDYVTTEMTGNTVVDDASTLLVDAFSTSAMNAAPAAGSAAASGGVTPSDAFFTNVSYKGAIDPSSDWTAGWTTNAQN